MSARSFRVIAVQPQWHAADFTSARAFRTWMRSQLEAARPHVVRDRPTLVVLTELNGLPLVLRGGGWALSLRTFERVALALMLARLPRTLPVLLRERVSPVRALQLADSDANTRLYLHTCRDLAREYGVYVCCGSAPMPRYRLQRGRLRRDPGVLTNQTVILAPDGTLVGTADKVNLTPDEEAGGVDLSPGVLDALRVFPTPVGDLGVAISLDAFRPEVIGRLEALGCSVLLQPDANGAPWTASEGLAPDPDHLRDQPVAWLDSSWAVTARGGQIRYAVNPMVVGNLLDLTFDGQSAVTGSGADAPELRSYVMTEARSGFLALAPWVEDGSPEHLRAVGRQLAAHSGDPRENAYHTAVLHADLTLPATTLPAPDLTPHEEALQALLADLVPPPRRIPWVLIGLGALVYALWRKR